MKITLQLIQNELLSLDAKLNTINLYPNRWLSTRDQILKDLLQRRDDLLFERDKILEIIKTNEKMKTLSDGIEVSARSYYYLLDWNEVNRLEYMYSTFDKHRICDLNIMEYRQLFCYATQMESTTMVKKITK